MSYGRLLREHLEGLLCDGDGSTRTLAAGRFHRRYAAQGDDRPERAVEVVVGPAVRGDATNSLDSLVIQVHPVELRVTYALAHGGDDAAEGLTEQTGAATLEALRDRATDDATDVAAVLEWHENWPVAGDDPAVIYIEQRPGDAPALTVEADVATLVLPYAICVQARATATPYAP